jgi:hypothetical protein
MRDQTWSAVYGLVDVARMKSSVWLRCAAVCVRARAWVASQHTHSVLAVCVDMQCRHPCAHTPVPSYIRVCTRLIFCGTEI